MEQFDIVVIGSGPAFGAGSVGSPMRALPLAEPRAVSWSLQ